MKQYSELTFTDDFIFCKVLTARLDLCKALLELILDIKIRDLLIHESQKTIEQTYDGRGIRLDVYVEDDQDTIYDIEMQTVMRRNLPKRSRYYQGMIDLNHIERGDSFDKLKKTFVIFICLSDPFDRGLPLYTFENICHEDGTLPLGDEAYKVFVNAKGSRAQLSHEMSAFLNYLLDRRIDSDLTAAIQAEINAALYGGRWETEYMTMRLKIQEERAEAEEKGRQEGMELGKEIGIEEGKEIGREEGKEIGREEGRELGREEGKEIGREEGREEGMEKGTIQTLTGLVKDGLLDLSTAAGRLNMTAEEFQRVMASVSL